MPSRVDAERDEGGELLEELYLGLRTREGVDLEALRERHGVDLLRAKRGKIEALIREGLGSIEDGRLRLGLRGWAVCDAVVSELL